VNNLLNFSRTSGTEFTAVDVNKIIADTLALLEHQFKTTKIQSAGRDEARHLPPIHGNAGRLQQVFLNLFLNAKDAMSSGGTLRIATANGDAVSVVVADTGSGIAQEHIHRIYDPFFTTKTGTARRPDARHGPGPFGQLRHHSGTRRQDSSGEPSRRRHDVLSGFPLTKKVVNV
jgi:two-component system, NtrC family, sensor kinase